MAVLDVLNLNLGTEQNPNWVAHDLHDKRISTTAVTTATHLLATNAGVTAMNPITAANLASVLGVMRFMGNINWSDIDSTKTQGLYMTIGAPYGDGYCQLIVTRWTSDANDVRQLVISTKRENNYEAYERFSRNGGSVWGSWLPVVPSFYKNYANLSSLASAIGGFNIGFTRKPLQAVKTLLFTVESSKPFVLVIKDQGLSGVAFGVGYSSAASNISVATDLNNNLHNMLSIEGNNVYVTPENKRSAFDYKWFYL